MRVNEPRLVGPIFGSLAALICFVIGRYIIPEQYQAARVLFIGVGGLALIFALAGWIDWAVFRLTAHTKAARMAWYGPWEYYRDTAREIRYMDRNQLRIFEHIGPLEVHGYFKNRSIYFVLHTSTINIPWTWIGDYINKCAKRYPELIPQFGTSGGSIERDYIQAFTREVVAAELADPPVGNKPAEWKVPLGEVVNLFGFGDDDE